MQSSDFVPTDNRLEVLRYLEALMEQSGASIQLDEEGHKPLPVVLRRAEADQPLVLDLDSAREAVAKLRAGWRFRLEGQSGTKVLRSDWLTADACREVEGVMQCFCPLPEVLYVLQRRDTFRAEVRKGLNCDVLVKAAPDPAEAANPAAGQKEWPGRLGDLSLGGCRVELPLGAAHEMEKAGERFSLQLQFPNGRRFAQLAVLRHFRTQVDRELVAAGFQFVEPSPDQSRELSFLVREIEREAARAASRRGEDLAPSPLFVLDKKQGGAASAASDQQHPTPMAANLARSADFLAAQIQNLRTGGSVDSLQLSRHAERLLRLLDQDREALLFATVCLTDQPFLIRHCLGTAIRLVDLTGATTPVNQRKSLMACAMVHDLGRALLPSELMWEVELDREQTVEFHRHVELLLPRLAECGWLDPAVITSVVEQANERLDGSGYPGHLREGDLDELARTMAVVDRADFMSHRQPGAGARSITAIYEHLLRRPGKYDGRVIKRYVEHFGRLPIGTLLRYEGGDLAWVLGLDERQRPATVQLAREVGPPRADLLGDVFSGRKLAGLGRPVEILVAEMAAE